MNIKIIIVCILLSLLKSTSAFGCSFSSLKGLSIITDPPIPSVNKPFTLITTFLYGGGGGNGNLLSANENALEVSLELPEGLQTIGPTSKKITPPVFGAGFDNKFELRWKVIGSVKGRHEVEVSARNISYGQGQDTEIVGVSEIIIADVPLVFTPTIFPPEPQIKDEVILQTKIIPREIGGRVIPIDNVICYYSTDEKIWEKIPLKKDKKIDRITNIWTCTIPPQNKDREIVNYYLEVTDVLGAKVKLPTFRYQVINYGVISAWVWIIFAILHLLLFGLIIYIIITAHKDFKKRCAQVLKESLVIMKDYGIDTYRDSIDSVIAHTKVEPQIVSWRKGYRIVLTIGILFLILGIILGQYQRINYLIVMG